MVKIVKNGESLEMTVDEYNTYIEKEKKQITFINSDGTIKGDNQDELACIWINGEKFTGISYEGLVSVNTKTYVEEPSRTNDGSIPNINQYETFFVPRVTVTFSVLSIDDYVRMSNVIAPNEFVVKYYDKRFKSFVSHKMYCEPEELTSFYNKGTTVIGLLDFSISFIGTLNDEQEFSVKYSANGGSIKNLKGEYTYNTEYSYGDVVIWNGDYWKAIYQKDNFNGIQPPNTTYWQELSNITEWSVTVNYGSGDCVNYGGNKYIATRANSGIFPTNKEYWKKLYETGAYNNETTYRRYDTCTLNDKTYVAIYFSQTFKGEQPDNVLYWVNSAELNDKLIVSWGQSMVLLSADSLFLPPTGKSNFKYWNTANDGSGYKYYPNQPINVFSGNGKSNETKDYDDILTLYAIWE